MNDAVCPVCRRPLPKDPHRHGAGGPVYCSWSCHQMVHSGVSWDTNWNRRPAGGFSCRLEALDAEMADPEEKEWKDEERSRAIRDALSTWRLLGVSKRGRGRKGLIKAPLLAQ